MFCQSRNQEADESPLTPYYGETHISRVHGRPVSCSHTKKTAKVRLPFVVVITTLLLLMSFSSGARSERPHLTPIEPDCRQVHWKILVLVYDRTDAIVTDGASGVRYHMVGSMTQAEVERATLAATQFVETDIPALTSGNVIPELTIRYPERALAQLDQFAPASWWPSPANTAFERDQAFDSIIVIWDPRVVDQFTGTTYWIGGAAGLAVPMGTGQTYAAIIIEATGYGHRNVFKHEWGHSILWYFEAVNATAQPTVTNHAVINQYVHWPTGESYVWDDETDANLIPNSIYNNQSGFTHDYYSGTTATSDQPTRRLGITPEAWMFGGPVTRPGKLQFPSPTFSVKEDAGKINITVTRVTGTTGTVTVDFATSNGTAIAGSDYTAASGTLTFLQGEASKSFSIPITSDNIFESDETINLTLSNPVGCSVPNVILGNPSTAVVTIKPPQILLVLEELAPPAPSQAAAVDALWFWRDPFPVISPVDYPLFNSGLDKNSRVIVFVTNLQLEQGETASSVRVLLNDSHGQSYDLGAEDVRLVPGFNFTQVKFRLPDNLAPGVCNIRIRAHNQQTNSGIIRIS